MVEQFLPQVDQYYRLLLTVTLKTLPSLNTPKHFKMKSS